MPPSMSPAPLTMTTAAPSAAVVALPVPGNAGVATVFPYAKAKLRLALYVALMACDVAALAAMRASGFTDGVKGPGPLLLFGLLAPLVGAYGLDALEHPGRGARRAAAATAVATIVAALLDQMRLSGGVIAATAALAATVLAIRIPALWLIARLLPSPSDEFVITDGDRRLHPACNGVDDLNRLGHLILHSDRVVIDAPPERRAAWLALLQGADVDVALRLDEAETPLVVRRAGLPLESRVLKRMLDLSLTLAALPVALPVMAALAVLIRLESPGPVLFRQWRVGRGNRQFVILKFRTMRHGAVDAIGHRSAQREDDRVTRIGRFMRRTSLDELPQLINVLGGSMSIVGPRPHPLGCRAGDTLFWHLDPAYAQRHAVKPGLTGLAQVRGFRGATHTPADLINRLRADQEYIARWSPGLDLAIIARTVAVLVHPNAY